ncbi:MAG: energy-coupling factor transporter transmembrane protein EcfT [Clostridiales bacterium]|nr:energy-coupling factor transporter transmembrane protein EcfT [Clostridiales bacterium]
MMGKNHKRGLWLDPRAKLFLILMCVLSSMFAPSLVYQFSLVLLIAILGGLSGKWKYAIKAVCFYAVICVLTVWIVAATTGTLRTMFVAFLGLFHKVYACGMLAGIVLSTTKVNEFLSAMNRIHAPKKFVIPFAVMLRYIPTIQEDWHFIKDAMQMRDVSPSLSGLLTNPGMTVECIYVPLMMMASKAADELSIASVTRGIENPNPRTCLIQIKCGIADWATMIIAVVFFVYELCVKGGVFG